MSLYSDKEYTCIECGEESKYPFNLGLCSSCTYKQLATHINSLCDTCSNKCKQSSLVKIQHCPDYSFDKKKTGAKQDLKTSPEGRKPASVKTSPKKGVITKKKPKKPSKGVKRKK